MADSGSGAAGTDCGRRKRWRVFGDAGLPAQNTEAAVPFWRSCYFAGAGVGGEFSVSASAVIRILLIKPVAAAGSLRCRKNKNCLSYLQLAESLVKEIACSFVSYCVKFAY